MATKLNNNSRAIGLRDVSLFFLFGFFLLKPFYILPSGSFQVGDLCLGLSFLFLVASEGANFRLERRDLLFAAFVGCVCLINSIYFALTGSSSFLLYSSYYIFALMGVLLFQSFCRDDKILLKIVQILRVGLIIQLVVFLLGIGRWMDSTRYMGTFNDPNQFGVFIFFAFLFIKCVGILTKSKQSIFDDVLALILLATTASTGMFLGFFVYYFCLFVKTILAKGDRKTIVRGIVVIAVVIVAAIFVMTHLDAIYIFLQSNSLGNRVIEKIMKFLFGQEAAGSSDFFTDRALTKIFYYPECFIYGSGEGDFSRYASIGSTNEMHSTIIGLFFYYGFIPFSILSLWVYKNIKNSFTMGTWIIIIPLLVECFTLANQRQPLFWMLIMLVGVSLIGIKDNPAGNKRTVLQLKGASHGIKR